MQYARTCASCQGVTTTRVSPSKIGAECGSCSRERRFRIARHARLTPIVRLLLEAMRQAHALMIYSELGAEILLRRELETAIGTMSETADDMMAEQWADCAGVGATATKDQLARVG